MNAPGIDNPVLYKWWAKLEKLWGGEIPEHLHREALRAYEMDDTPDRAAEILRAFQ